MVKKPNIVVQEKSLSSVNIRKARRKKIVLKSRKGRPLEGI